MSINPASRSYSILIADAAVSVVNTACTAWRLHVRTDREGTSDRTISESEEIDQNEKPAQWPAPQIFNSLICSTDVHHNHFDIRSDAGLTVSQVSVHNAARNQVRNDISEIAGG
ncbi:hypothetical protein HAP41_0000006825 [Bradyrhizobium barranii subsp. apii]|uniref:Uncharacterized protein n=1 Tax=Bradyrhizobium barranii subsp. apii TaxID=2819348 RepID=A0A8T5VG04_9BRAD|nr:hypothetical protein [Bradyrhizobium barranii]UPT88758.1 hypothetical protein HAP41_0000006825 [Bradyrhizobium barranii subsp. apii]UPT96009.1 hypothetical protein J4G48_0044145 [Bradyrhizobium barranii subsp. apii]